jgi:hypothetical protein
VKLVVAASMLAGSLGVGVVPRVASASTLCPPICCDASCRSVRQCFRLGGSCVCQEYCVIRPIDN